MTCVFMNQVLQSCEVAETKKFNSKILDLFLYKKFNNHTNKRKQNHVKTVKYRTLFRGIHMML